MLTQDFQSFKHWYIIFTPQTNGAKWWQKLGCLGHRRKYGHVLLIRQITNTHALYIDPESDGCVTELLEFSEGVASAIGKTAVDFPVISLIHKPECFWNFSCHIPSCVTLVKYMLALNAPSLTPKHLHDYLLKYKDAKLL